MLAVDWIDKSKYVDETHPVIRRAYYEGTHEAWADIVASLRTNPWIRPEMIGPTPEKKGYSVKAFVVAHTGDRSRDKNNTAVIDSLPENVAKWPGYSI